jgi:lipoprotein-anchoring transpeptidase ErfK/SrfK
MRKISPSVLFLSLALLTTSCATTTPTNSAPPSNAGTASANANAEAAPTASPAALGSSEAELPVTLPVLDALFDDTSFAAALKAKVQLTNEQIERLRQVAREGTASLSESEAESGRTAEATRVAAEKVNAIIGEEKSAAFAAFVRERWGEGVLPSQPNSVPTDTRIVVNAPAYRMDVFENGQLIKTYKVGIGYPEFPLPQGLRKADTIIFNPTWTPPDEPWVRGKLKPGQPSLIHGGKNPARLGTFASHGCVGLTNSMVQDFALLLAEAAGAPLTQTQVAAYAQKRDKTQTLKLPAPVPVELRYETIVVEDGRLHIYRDVYDKGTNTEDNLRKVLNVYGVKLEDLSEEERAQTRDALQAMARDVYGNPVNPANAGGRKKSQSGRVTYGVKGDKEIVIEIAKLQGKGYPAPVNLMPASAQPKKETTPAKKETTTPAKKDAATPAPEKKGTPVPEKKPETTAPKNSNN